MKYLGSISNSMSHVTKEYVDDAISNIGGGSGGSYDDSELREELSKKADVDGVYPEMTVGMTRDMLGVGEGDEGEFLFRPTDGEGSIKDGFASIEKIEGNSVVWNQMVNGVGSLTLINSHKYMTIIGGVAKVKTSIVTLDVAKGDRAYDLTRMFGAGNEPSTVEEFYARLPKGIDINAYNEGEVVNMNVEGIKSVGFNAWDEEWESGNFHPSTGQPVANGNLIRSINPIPVIGGETYYFNKGSYKTLHIYQYTASDAFISHSERNVNSAIVLTSETAYLRVSLTGTTYNHDVCINLVHTGYRNGEYEPYVSDEIALPIADYFPNGMNSIGDVKDELTATEAIQRIGVVDMGTLNWTYFSACNCFTTNGLSAAKYPSDVTVVPNIITSSYSSESYYGFNNGSPNGVVTYNIRGVLMVRDTSFTDAASFKAAMSGVMLYYELAEPIVTSIDKPLPLDYQVWDFGTEEAIAEGKTTPLKASIVYEFNARDTIRKNRNDIAKLNKELLQLKTTIGAGPYVLNATILDLNRAIQYYEGEQNITDLAEIRNALVNHRTIHIKYGSNYDGYFVVGGYIDGTDIITLEFWYGLTHYSIEIDSTTQIGDVSQYDIV